MDSAKRSHAVVIGGSIAGLCAARARRAHFERVTAPYHGSMAVLATNTRGDTCASTPASILPALSLEAGE